MPKHIGNVIEQIRMERGLNQVTLAALAGIQPNTLGDLEQRRSNSRIETLEKVAAALKLSVGELYRQLEEKPGPLPEDERLRNICTDPDHGSLFRLLDSWMHGKVSTRMTQLLGGEVFRAFAKIAAQAEAQVLKPHKD